MRRYHIRLMVSVLVSLSAVAWAGESGRIVIAQAIPEMIAQTDAEALLEVEGILESGDPILDDGSLYDIHTFTGTAGQTVSITLESLDFDTYLLIVDSKGNTLVENDDINSENTDSGLVFRVPADGTYGIVANAFDANGRGNYQLIIQEVTATELRTAEADHFFQEGLQQFNDGQFTNALEKWEQALIIYREVGDRRGEMLSIGSIGDAYNELEQYDLAIEFYEQTLPIAVEVGDRLREGRSFNNLGSIYFHGQGEYEQAISAYQQSLEISREIESSELEVIALGKIGEAYFALEQYEQGIDFSYEALAVAQNVGDRQKEAATFGNLGGAYIALIEYEKAIEFFQQQLLISREIQDRQGESNALNGQGAAYLGMDQYERAIEFFQKSLAIQREINDLQGQAWSLGNMGNAYGNLGQFEQAINSHQQALEIATEHEFKEWKAATLNHLGLVYDYLGEYEQAIELYLQALEIARAIGDHQTEANTSGNLGGTYESLGQYESAMGFLQQQLTISRQIGDRNGESDALGRLGIVYSTIGQYQRAIDFHQQSLVIDREVDSRRGEAASLGNLGIVHNSLGQFELAIDFHDQSLEIEREIGNRQGEAQTLGGLGNVYENLGQYERAIEFHEQSLAIKEEIGDLQGQTDSLGNIGNAYFFLGEYERGLVFQQQSLALARQIGDSEGEAASLGSVGIGYLRLGQYEQAIEFLQQALEMQQEIGDREGEAISLYSIGALFLETGRFSEAETMLRKSVEISESLRDRLTDSQLIAIADTQRVDFLTLEKALIAQDEIGEALAITERGRGRAFVLQLASRLANEEERAALEASPVAQIPTTEKIQQIARDTNTTLVTYSLIFDQALYIWVVQPSGEIEFRSVEFEGSSDDGLIANPIATLDGPLYRGTSEPSELDTLVTDTRTATLEVVRTGSTAQTSEKLQELHQLLIDPIADLLPTDPNAQVAFIPQGKLFLVPFAAIQDEDGTYLIEKHTILTAPSIQVFGLASKAGSSPLSEVEGDFNTENALIVGNPVMPTVWLPNEDGDLTETELSYLGGAEAEAEAIGNFFNTVALIGEQATEARIKQALPTASLIHLATHGLLEYGIPESSGVLDIPGAVALAPGDGEDGLLTSAEILEMELQADLAILSACDTGRGRITGDGVVGLSRALITAGVPSVMVSLWAVNDASTSVLMQRFYEFLATGEFTKAEALRQAQLSLLYGEDVETRLESVRAGAAPQYREGFEPVGDRHPYHWAPFILIGNGL